MADAPSKGTKVYGFNAFAKALDPAVVRAELKRRLRIAHNQVGLEFKRTATEVITETKPFDDNRPLTILLKGSSTPLVNNGDLVGDLSWQVKSTEVVRLGISSGPKVGPSGRSLRELLHNGATIKITPKMRKFLMNAWAKKVGGWKVLREMLELAPHGPRRSFLVIAPRPYLSWVFKNRAWQARTSAIYQRNIDALVKRLMKLAKEASDT